MSEYSTPCCKAEYGIGGEGSTHWYLCTTCGKPVAVIESPTEEEAEALLLQCGHGVG
jgi:DNA-directed RNA polymerase subunit RPC12/RpoP